MRFPWNFPELAERDHVLACKHLYESVRDRKPQPETHWRKGGRFTREDGTEGSVKASLLCVDCRDSIDPKEVDYIEFISVNGCLLLADAVYMSESAHVDAEKPAQDEISDEAKIC